MCKKDICFSVIMPVYNRAATIERALDSVIEQTHPADEIIVVDDGCTDSTVQLLEKYLSKIKLISQKNRGVSAARNAGIKVAKSNWLTFLDSDDQWLPEKLELAVKFINSNPDSRIFQSEEIWVRNGKRVNPKDKHQKYAGYIFRQSLPLCIVSPSAVVIHNSIFHEIGGFDESLEVCEDYDLWLRVSRKYPIGLDRNPGILKYGGHSDQLSRKYWGMDRFRITAMEKQLADPELPDNMRIWVLEEIIKKLSILISGFEKHGKDISTYKKKLDDSKKSLELLKS